MCTIAVAMTRMLILGVLAAIAGPAAAQQKPAGLPGNYPAKPVRVIIGTAPGGSTDFLGRTILGKVGEKWGTSFIMENMSSAAGSIIALDAALKAPADGYTLLVTSGSTFQNATFVHKAAYDVRKVFAPIAQFVNAPLVMAVNASLPVNNVRELIAYAKSKPGELNIANTGVGSSAHLSGELFKYMTGTDMLAVPYKGVAPSVMDTVAGRTQVTFGTSVALLPHVRAGKLKLMGITSPTRIPSLPEVPTIAEMGVPGFALTSWIGAVARTGTPPAILTALHLAAIDIIKSAEVQKALAVDGSDPSYSTQAQFREVIDDALDRAEKLIRESGLKLE
jgi:tripartite-type tricarboxylate transporter receptor subunit TctC